MGVYLIKFKEDFCGKGNKSNYYSGEKVLKNGFICSVPSPREEAKVYYYKSSAANAALVMRLNNANVYSTSIVEVKNDEEIEDKTEFCEDDATLYPFKTYLHLLENSYYMKSLQLEDLLRLREERILAGEEIDYIDGLYGELLQSLFSINYSINKFKTIVMKEADLNNRIDITLGKEWD